MAVLRRLRGLMCAMIGRPDTTETDKHSATVARADAGIVAAEKVSRDAWRARRVVASYRAGDAALDARRRKHW